MKGALINNYIKPLALRKENHAISKFFKKGFTEFIAEDKKFEYNVKTFFVIECTMLFLNVCSIKSDMLRNYARCTSNAK